MVLSTKGNRLHALRRITNLGKRYRHSVVVEITFPDRVRIREAVTRVENAVRYAYKDAQPPLRRLECKSYLASVSSRQKALTQHARTRAKRKRKRKPNVDESTMLRSLIYAFGRMVTRD